MVGILAGERGRRKGGLYHYMLGLERETRVELATLCLGSIGLDSQFSADRPVWEVSGRLSASEAEGLVVVLPAQLPNLDGVFEAPQFGLTHVRDNGLSETQLPRER